MIICLSGKSGSGKSTVADLFCNISSSFLPIDIDLISHKIIDYPKISHDLVKTFGNTILKEGKIDRKELGRIVFHDEKKMKQLEDITWNAMEKEIDFIINRNSDKFILLDWQLLPKTKYFELADIKILVDAPLEIRKKRAISRDKISEEKFMERENASLDLYNYSFDEIIVNDGKRILKDEVYRIYEKSIVHRKF